MSRYFREAETRFLVMDTAPEGHTLLLIDAADTYHRAAANRLGIERTFRTPLEFLQEPALTRAIFVTRAEPPGNEIPEGRPEAGGNRPLGLYREWEPRGRGSHVAGP